MASLLVRRVTAAAEIAKRARRQESLAASAIGLCWALDTQRIDESLVGPGDYIAMDVYFVGYGRPGDGSNCAPPGAPGHLSRARMVERLTRDEQDLGWCYAVDPRTREASSKPIGRITRINGTLFEHVLWAEPPGLWEDVGIGAAAGSCAVSGTVEE